METYPWDTDERDRSRNNPITHWVWVVRVGYRFDMIPVKVMEGTHHGLISDPGTPDQWDTSKMGFLCFRIKDVELLGGREAVCVFVALM